CRRPETRSPQWTVAAPGSHCRRRRSRTRASDRPPARAGLLDRVENVVVAAAPADVAGHGLADLLVGARVPVPDHRDRGHDLAGRAEAALETVVLDERLLHRVQLLTVPRETFDRGDLLAVDRSHEGQAGHHPPSVD